MVKWFTSKYVSLGFQWDVRPWGDGNPRTFLSLHEDTRICPEATKNPEHFSLHEDTRMCESPEATKTPEHFTLHKDHKVRCFALLNVLESFPGIFKALQNWQKSEKTSNMVKWDKTRPNTSKSKRLLPYMVIYRLVVLKTILTLSD